MTTNALHNGNIRWSTVATLSATITITTVAVGVLLKNRHRRRHEENRDHDLATTTTTTTTTTHLHSQRDAQTPPPRTLRVVYGTTTGTAKKVAEALLKEARSRLSPETFDLEMENMKDYDFDGLAQEDVVVFVVSTWTGGAPPPNCEGFFANLAEATVDYRYGRTALANVFFAVYGVGSAEYSKSDYCVAAKKLDRQLGELGGRRVASVGSGSSDHDDLPSKIARWAEGTQLWGKVLDAKLIDEEIKARKKHNAERKIGKGGGDVAFHQDDDDDDDGDGMTEDDDEEQEEEEEEEEDRINGELANRSEPLLADVEDLEILIEAEGGGGSSRNKKKGGGGEGLSEMVTPLQRRSLTKQGYKIIGSHSGVKLCRWTKSQLRGRGGCYKHTLYGINSYQCMEATPSLACANKCTFCWRTHTNPVGREWRWKQDAPDFIVAKAIEEHRGMIRQLRGMPGAIPERLRAGDTVRHCALSLVGEPIMYPRINDLLRELHDRHISSFLVTNAQFPEPIRTLSPVTQLYVSIDAADRDSLKAIDRPLFADFWERFQASLAALSEVCGRTVFRLTIVKDKNAGTEEHLVGYARLVAKYKPDLVEIKGVTFCGKSEASDLRMANVPWHHEVRAFSLRLCELVTRELGGAAEYGPACEHAHSVCVLLAKKSAFMDAEGRWNTWIDYERFQQLEREWRRTGRRFGAGEYRAPTPSWALFGSPQEGFNPEEKRFTKVRRHHNNSNRVKEEDEEEKDGCG